MIQIHINNDSEIIAQAIEVFERTGSILQAVESVRPMYEAELDFQIMQAVAAVMGGESQ